MPKAAIESGTVVGTALDANVVVFKGIPYAAPPVGPLRWRPPQSVEPWSGIRDATRFGADCMQDPEPSDAAPVVSTPAEDCLFVNVWAPVGAKAAPVLAWIHGGGFVNGGCSPEVYNGAAFARSGLVFLSFNYRLGRFGFFAHPALSAERGAPGGNFGLMDQVAALEWITRNVGTFGGDPDRVTLMGQSAGGASILYHLASPAASRHFAQAVVMSGGGRDHLLGGLPLDGPAPSGVAAGIAFARKMGIEGTGEAALTALRTLPGDAMAEGISMSALLRPSATYAMGPLVDGVTVAGSPARAFRNGAVAPKPLLIGTTSDDMPVAPSVNFADPLAYFGADAAAAKMAYGALDPRALAVAVGADVAMHEPARFAARQMTAVGAPAWLYRFGYVPETLQDERPGAGHASELPFLFRTLAAGFGPSATDADREVSDALHGRIAAFALMGDPNVPGEPHWPRFESEQFRFMNFRNTGQYVEEDPWRTRLELVERVVDS